VVEAKSGRDAGEKRIVVLDTGGVRGVEDVLDRELEHIVLPREVPVSHDRRERVRHRSDEARDIRAGRDRLADRAARVAQRVRDVADRGPEVTLGEVEQVRPVVGEGVLREVNGAKVLCDRGLRHRTEIARVGLAVVQQASDVHPADPVGERMVQFGHDRCLAALQPLDDRELPQRPVFIEAGHAGLARELEHGRERLGGRGLEPADMPVEIEIGVDDPAGGRQAQRRHHDAVPEPRRLARTALKPLHEQVKVEAAIEDRDGDHRRAEQRVLLHVPRERVTVSHVHVDVFVSVAAHTGSPSFVESSQDPDCAWTAHRRKTAKLRGVSTHSPDRRHVAPR
jgi:hypothetical protein